jgi:hypothetical protein
MLSWEYLVLDVSYQDLSTRIIITDSSRHEEVLAHAGKDGFDEYLSRLRGEGWEYIHQHSMDENTHVYYFRRRVQ